MKIKNVAIFDFVDFFLLAGGFYTTASAPVSFHASYVPPISNTKVQNFSFCKRNDPVNFSEL